MKKTKLTRSLLAACSIVALTAVMYGCVHDGGSDPEPMVEPMPEPEPEPDPGPPADLTDTQQDAADAAEAAMMASTGADEAATAAETATANIATLQTGETAMAAAMDARKYAKAAMAAADDAKMASDAAAAATTGSEAEAAKRMALDAQDDAEAAAETAGKKSEAAIKAAMTELHINGTMKRAGKMQADGTIVTSSIDAEMGMLTKTADDGSKTITGFQGNLMRENSGALVGRPHSEPQITPVVPYRQAVEARDLAIGKTLDTTDDMARVTVIHSRASSQMVRVYAEGDTATNFTIRTNSDGLTSQATGGTASTDPITEATTAATNKLRSVGMYHRVTESTETGTDGETYTYTAPATNPLTPADNELDPSDLLQEMTKPKEVFSYVDSSGATPVTMYVVETSRLVNAGTGNTDVTYQHVDTTAPAAPDTAADADAALDVIPVKAALPVAIKYDHIHFGVWATLGDAEKDGSQKLADLGIGFVQNIKGGVTEKQGIGTATYTGDWVAIIQRENSAAKGAYNMDDGGAVLTADFDEDEFEAALTGLATLSGALSGNGFSGTKATQIAHDDLDSTGTFTGTFSGNIYGPKGTEAAGVFDFTGGEAGAFRGAFGGSNED